MSITINGNGTVSGLTAAPNLTSSGLTTGKILLVKQTVKADTASTTSLDTFEDISGMSVDITPSATNSKILIIGAGGLGCPVAEFLTRAGIGELGIVDFDKVNLSNLHRQSLFESKDIGKYKVSVIKNILKRTYKKLVIFKFTS